MASSTSGSSRCVTCEKVAGTFTCRGCSKDFCLRHASDHRQSLTKQMDEEVVLFHDQLQQSFNEYSAKPNLHPLVKQIDEWEKQSVDKIYLVADDIRKKLIVIIGEHVDSVKKSLAPLTQQVTKARYDDEFFENDINNWKKRLSDLKQELNTLQTIRIQQDDNVTPLIFKISLIDESSSFEVFDKLTGAIHIEDNGRVITHDRSTTHALVRGKGEYSSGQHRFRFRIERLGKNKWILFGIISKSAPVAPEDLYHAPKSCGWGGNNSVFLNGNYQSGFNGYQTDIEVNDILELFIDCDRRKIRMTNERTQNTHELDIDITKCPFPWQVSLNLYDSDDRVRILP